MSDFGELSNEWIGRFTMQKTVFIHYLNFFYLFLQQCRKYIHYLQKQPFADVPSAFLWILQSLIEHPFLQNTSVGSLEIYFISFSIRFAVFKSLLKIYPKLSITRIMENITQTDNEWKEVTSCNEFKVV